MNNRTFRYHHLLQAGARSKRKLHTSTEVFNMSVPGMIADYKFFCYQCQLSINLLTALPDHQHHSRPCHTSSTTYHSSTCHLPTLPFSTSHPRSRQRLNNRQKESLRIKIRLIPVQLVHARNIRLLQTKRIAQFTASHLPHQISAVEDKFIGDCIGRSVILIAREANWQDFVFSGADVEEGA